MERNVIILAAGKSKRMKSKTGKVMHKILGKEVVRYMVDLSENLGSTNNVLVLNQEGEAVKKALQDKALRFATQEPQLGTGHALQCALDQLEEGPTLILMGDTPCIKEETLRALFDFHEAQGNALTVLTVEMSDPFNYGRILRSGDQVRGIREHRDCTETELAIKEINSGVFLLDRAYLHKYLPKLKNDNAQQEYYATDLIMLLSEDGEKVGAFKIFDEEQILGINSREQLWQATKVLQQRINQKWMQEGVTMLQPESIFIDATVTLGQDVTLLPGVILEGNCFIDEDSVIGPNVHMVDCTVGKACTVENSTMYHSSVGDHSTVGPFAYMRPGSMVGAHCKVGDFVEVKNSTMGDNTKVSHLSYIGDADVGANVNIGCGVVFVNYDGRNKFRTTVEDNAFVGCNVNLVAPVTVKKGAYVAAGTTVTDDVPEEALAIGRARASIKEGWAKGKNKKAK